MRRSKCVELPYTQPPAPLTHPKSGMQHGIGKDIPVPRMPVLRDIVRSLGAWTCALGG